MLTEQKRDNAAVSLSSTKFKIGLKFYWPPRPALQFSSIRVKPSPWEEIMKLGRAISAAILLSVIAAASASGQEARKSISKPSPRYPEVAKRLNLVGTVKVEILIGPDGKIKNANILGGHPIFANSTLDALKDWKYEPSKTETTVILTFEF